MYAFGVGSLVVPVALEGCSQSMVSAFYGSTAGLDAMLDMDASGGRDVGVLVAPDAGAVDAGGGDGGPDAD
jgi:hypothetical protein